MKNCPKCNSQLEDNAAFCGTCGFNFSAPPVQGYQNPQQMYAQYDPFDHTAEFDAKDISENKVFAMLVYLLGVVGVIIALLASSSSAYTKFHLRQALKFTVVEVLTGLVSLLLVWTVIVPIVGGIFIGILEIIKIICFFQVCSGKAKEPAIIKSFNFLK